MAWFYSHVYGSRKGYLPVTHVCYVDIETTSDEEGEKIRISPFFGQQLVSIGTIEMSESYYGRLYHFFYHKKREPDQNAFERVQISLDRADVLVGHNLKFDLQWMRECGFVYNGPIFDTMVADYLLLRGQKKGLSLDECCKRRGIDGKNTEILEHYLRKGKSFDEIPPNLVEEYGMNDVEITKMLANKQLKDFNTSWEGYAHATNS